MSSVVDSAGTVVTYTFDPSGNIVAITRSTLPSPNTLAVFNVTPTSGDVGIPVLIQGQGFSPAPANDIVMFNGVQAAVTTATATQLTAVVPATATTGPLTLTVGGVTVQGGTFTVIPQLVSITVAPANASIPLGTGQQFTATGNFSNRTSQDLTGSVFWKSSTSGVATITGAGLASSVGIGTTVITASVSLPAGAQISGSVSLTVGPPAITSIRLTPSNSAILVGGTLHFVATGMFTDGSQQNVTTAVTWSSSNTAVATISNSTGSEGAAIAVATGTTTITAASGSVSDLTTLTVNALSTGSVPRFGYVMNCESLSIFTLNPETGLVRANGEILTGPFCASSLTIEPVGRFLYFLGRPDSSVYPLIFGFAITPTTGALLPLPGSPFALDELGGSLTIDPTGSFLYVLGFSSSYATTQVGAFAIDPTSGALAPVAGSPFIAASAPSAVSMTVDSSGKFLYVGNNNGNLTSSLSAFAIDRATGALAEVTGSPFVAGQIINSVVADPAGGFVYATDNLSHTVYGFAIDPTSGTLTAVAGSPFAAGRDSQTPAIDPTGRFLYVADHLSNKVVGFIIDRSTGALTTVPGSPFSGPQGVTLTVDPSGNFLYWIGSGPFNSALSVFNIDSTTGALTLAGTPRTRVGSQALAFSSGSVAVTYTPKAAYVASSGDNALSGSTINPSTGDLTPITGSPFQAGTNPTSVTTDLSGRFAFAANHDSDNVSAYTIDASSGALTAVGSSPVVAGTSPTSVVVDASGTFAYVSNRGSNDISAYTVDSTTGALTTIVGSPYGAGAGPAAITIDSLGQFAYVANQGSNDISVYSINLGGTACSSGPTTIGPPGRLCAVNGSPFPAGTGPVSIVVDPSAQFAYVVNANSGDVSAYSIGLGTGVMTPVPGSPFAAGTNPQAVVVEPLGKFVYVAGGAQATPGTISAFRINPTSGALTALTGSPFAVGLNPTAVSVDVSGKFLYVTNSGDNTISEFIIDPDTGALSPDPAPTSPTGNNPKSIVTTGTIR